MMGESPDETPEEHARQVNLNSLKVAMEQAFAALNNEMPSGLMGFYAACRREGFDDDSAMNLTEQVLERILSLIFPLPTSQ